MPRFAAITSVDEWHDYLDENDAGTHRKEHAAARQTRGAGEHPDLPHVETDFNPSFTGSRHEREWILTYLSRFHQDRMISDVLRVVKGGKEATVYCCRAHPNTGLDLIAAKVQETHQLVDEILLAARLDGGSVPVNIEELDLNDVVLRAVERSEGRAALASADVEAAPAAEPVRVSRAAA